MPPETESSNVRPPQVAGAFYPGGRSECAAMVTSCLGRARPTPPMSPKVVVAPHAGWVYSGDIAATVFAPLAARRRAIRRVVIVGPAHRVGFDGLATTSAEAWATPLGRVPVDWPAMAPLLSMPGFRILDAAFAGEHSLEVHLPFLQRVLDDFTIVPILVGEASHTEAARALERVWGGPETLILVSTDLSHFHACETARRLDRATAKRIELMRPKEIDGAGACGHRGLGGALERARALDLRVTALDVRNSGDTRGGRDRVVGYGAFAMEYAAAARTCDEDRARLLEAARASLAFAVENGRAPKPALGSGLSPSLTAMRAAFVTLKIKGRLRGCVGSVGARRPLLLDVAANAYQAGFADPRFGPLTREELDALTIDIAVLSTPRPIRFTGEAELLREVRPDVDGLIVKDGTRQGLFLPSVWERFPKAEGFVKQLKGKAGFEPEHRSDDLRVFRFTTERFGEPSHPA